LSITCFGWEENVLPNYQVGKGTLSPPGYEHKIHWRPESVLMENLLWKLLRMSGDRVPFLT
jgi:hypothetical protein